MLNGNEELVLFKGRQNSFSDLPPVGESIVGDMWRVVNDGYYLFNDLSQWEKLNKDEAVYNLLDEINEKIDNIDIPNIINLLPPVDTKIDLDNTTGEVGDMREVLETGVFYIYTSNGWTPTGGLTNLSDYYKKNETYSKDEIDSKITTLNTTDSGLDSRISDLESNSITSESDPLFSEFKTSEYDVFKTSVTNDITLLKENSFVDAPSDDKTYGRKNEEWVEVITPEMLSNAISGFLTEDEITQLIADLTASLVINGSTLSDGEREAVIDEVETQIASHPNGVTAEQVQQMIDTALGNLETPLTEEQIKTIINDSVLNISGMITIPDYDNGVVVRNETTGFFPKSASTTPQWGDKYVVEQDGYMSLYAFPTISQAANFYARMMINGVMVARAWTNTVRASLTTGIFEVKSGDEISFGLEDVVGKSISYAASRLQFYPIIQGSNNVIQSDLSSFATIVMLSDSVNEINDKTSALDNTDTELDSRITDLENSVAPSETDPIFAAWKLTDYDSFKPNITNRVSVLESGLANTYTKTETTELNTQQTQEITDAYNAAISTAIGNLQSQGLTQDQINQIIAAMPEIDAITQSQLDAAMANILTQANGFTTQQISAVKSELTTVINAVQAALDSHKATDRHRWQDAYLGERDSIIRDAENIGLKPNESGTATIPAPTDPMTVNDEAGGVMGVTFSNTDTTFCTININGIDKYSSDGLTAGVPVTKYFWLKTGDTITSTNAQTYTYIPFVRDPNSVMAIMQAQISANSTIINNLQNQILDIKAGIDGKILDTSNTISIEDSTYTIANDLGGRLSGVGFTTIGLLGIRVVSTGTVDITVNDTTTRVYDNTSILAVGEAEPFSLDVAKDTIVVSASMAQLTFTPYKLGNA